MILPLRGFWPKVRRGGDKECWVWLGFKTKDGYGRFCTSRVDEFGRRTQTNILAHRFSYREVVGPIPFGTEIDHLCRNRACVNPAHLEAVTHRTNILRGNYKAGGSGRGRQQLAKKRCPQGHPYSGKNLYVIPSSKGRVCRICQSAATKRWREKNR